jgi:cytochrome P450
MRALALFFGLPVEDIEQWDRWTGEIFSSRTENLERQERAFQEIVQYLDEQMEQRRRHPGDDYFSLLTRLEIDGRRLTDAELRGYGRMMIIAGRGATIDALGNGLWYLAEHPEIRLQLLQDPELLRSAVEEFLRIMTPLEFLGRIAAYDVVVHGQQIRQGDSVALNFACANHDERMFDQADACVLGRRPNPHLAFGAGPHSCLGAHVARLILRVGMREWLRRIPHFRLTGEHSLESAVRGGIFRFETLPVRFESEA